MNLQLIILLALFVAASFFFIRRVVNQFKRKKSGCDNCGIAEKPSEKG